MVKVLKEHPVDTLDMRAAYCNTLIEEAEKDPRIVAIDCDLCSSMGMKPFAQKYPERHFNVGIAESNGAGIAGGLSATGLIPFFHTFSAFASRRVYDQVFLTCAYAGQNVKIIGGDAGITASYNGGTHMSFEDMGIMRVLPTLTVLEPTDAVMMKSITRQLVNYPGVVYLRTPRKATVKIYEEGSEFEIGKAVTVRDGSDVTIFTLGLCVSESLKAAEILEKEGISARVVDMFTIKPIDAACVIECAKQTGAVVTAENHNIIGGLGSAVAEVLVENVPVPMERVGVKDEFGEVGEVEYLIERFGLTAPHIVEAAKKAVARKK